MPPVSILWTRHVVVSLYQTDGYASCKRHLLPSIDIGNYNSPSEIFNALFETLAPRDAAEAQSFLGLMSQLWNHTPRYELRGRTPTEVRAS